MTILVQVFIWWFAFLLLGLCFLPLTFKLFDKFEDYGYIFSKSIAVGIVSYLVFIVSTFKLMPFSLYLILISILLSTLINYLFIKNSHPLKKVFEKKRIFFLEELSFLILLFFWTYIRSFSPDINGLEKFMDFGFINSILRSDFFPPKDIWFPPFSINYYYFGHVYTAILTKLTMIPSNITYNLMVSTIFSLTFVSSFSIGLNLIKSKKLKVKMGNAFLSAMLVTFGGNLHTVYAFFKNYDVENVKPFWSLTPSPLSFPNDYWYPNATRFIPFTIHEFPIYSFVVSDLHGHVLDIPFILLEIALILSLFYSAKINKIILLSISFFLALSYMTNAWDAAIYFVLLTFSLIYLIFKDLKQSFPSGDGNNTKKSLLSLFKMGLFTTLFFLLFTAPFSINFKPFVSGIGIICAPDFLTNLGHFGPLLFEKNHCQTSPPWQILILYGFFYIWVILLIAYWYKKKFRDINPFLFILILISTLLLLAPEFVYFKDIYPQHYRANTMFKLGYQAFILLSFVSSYSIITLLSSRLKWLFAAFSIPLLTLILIYPKFAIYSYYGSLKIPKGIDGTSYIAMRYPNDYKIIKWINANIKKQPVILEAQGDSYTDYARISANTGLPTILGWTVHEWLWRGSYNIPAPRIEEIKSIYESKDISLTKSLLKKYDVKYVYVGDLERQKYQNIDENKFSKFGKMIFKSNSSKLYKLDF